MKPLTHAQLEEHLKHAVNRLSPDTFDAADQLWEKPVEKASGHEWYLDGTNRSSASGKTPRKAVISIFSSLAACFLLFFLSYGMTVLKTDATVYLDVNPAVELAVNRNDKVVSATADNPDGEIILEGMDLKHTDLDVAVNAILGSMVKHGYLSDQKNTVLLSVACPDTEKSSLLRSRLSDEIDRCLTTLVGSGTVFDQKITLNEDTQKMASQYAITPGKAALLQKLLREYPELDDDVLAKLPMKDLVMLLNQIGIDLQPFINQAELNEENSQPPDVEDSFESLQEGDDRPDSDTEPADPEDVDSDSRTDDPPSVQETESDCAEPENPD